MANAYASVDVLKGTSVLNIGTITTHDARLRVLLEAASRAVDQYTNRTFFARTDTLFFDGPGGTLLLTPDLVSVGSLTEDNNMDGTFDTAWGSLDYFLSPFNANPTSTAGDARPYWAIQVSSKSDGTQDSFARGTRNYRVIGTWGYQSVTLDSLLNASGSMDSTATTLNLSGSASGTIEAGMTILIDTEQMFVTQGPANATATAVTVLRAVNGSTAGTHASGTNVNVFQYPDAVKEAVLMQAGRLYKRAQSGFANESGAPEGIITVFRGGLDGDVKALLAAFRKFAV